MEKALRIKNDIKGLEQQKLMAERLIASSNERIDQKKMEMAECYQNYFDKKRNKEFILYDRFPSAEVLEMYIRRISSKFPLHEYGNLNIKELAELIKHCYQFQRDSEYDIVTIGVNECEGSPIYGGQSWSVKPHLYFLIGNDSTLAPYREYDGQYINDDRLHNSIYLYAKGKDLICLELEDGYDKPKLKIECLTESYTDTQAMINYYDLVRRNYVYCGFSETKNIYDDHLNSKIGKKGRFGYNGIKDVLSFNIHILDTFLAKILVSTSIYKRNNNIEKLTEEDYNHIFDSLYGEKVDIIYQSEIDIPKKLVYVPNRKFEK